jgi:uncharacterized protein (TIGR00730 family)
MEITIIMKKDLKKSMKQISKLTDDFTTSAIGMSEVGDAVSVFGSARLKPNTKAYKDCVEFSRRLADKGISILTGGGPGLMAAGNEGASQSDHKDSHSVAIGIELPFEQGFNEFADIKLSHKYFATRKIHLTKHSFAYVAFSGGIGTIDEIAEIGCLINTQRLESKPIILVDRKFFQGFIDWMKDVMVNEGVITVQEIDEIFVLADDVDHAVALIEEYHQEWSKTQHPTMADSYIY